MDQTETTVAGSLEDDASTAAIAALHPLVSEITSKFEAAKHSRLTDEQRLNRAYFNFRGLYGKEIAFTTTEKSRVFVKITKTKVMAAYGQLVDVLFSSTELPITIEATPVPEGIEETVHIDLKDPKEGGGPGAGVGDNGGPPMFGFPGDGNTPAAGTTITDKVGSWLAAKLQGAKIKDGAGVDPASHITLSPADIAAKKMHKKIHDQLVETDAVSAIAAVAMEAPLLGTGILKGPFAQDKEYPKWDDDGNYAPVTKTQPRLEAVSCWDFYPDPEARTFEDCDYVIQRHRLTRSSVRMLNNRPFFRASAIEEAIAMGPSHERLWWEHEIDDTDIENTQETRYEVLEFWGSIDKERLDELDFDVAIPEKMEDQEEFQINVWLCNGKLFRVVINPFRPLRLPYQLVPYERNPYGVFGIGLAENMEDCQTIMNGFARMAIDNAALSGSLMIEVDETNLVPGQSMDVYPGKIWRRAGGAPGQAIFGTKWPSTVQDNMQVFDKFRQLADEATGMPSYSHGQTGVSGTTRTAAGMSMLMGASALNIKTVVKNFDIYLLEPLGKAMFAWNMQFDYDKDIKGDLAIKASGTTSLMQREVKSQRVIQFLQVAATPMTAPFINFEYLAKEIARTLDLDPEKAVNDPKMAALQATLLGTMQNTMDGGIGQPGQDPMSDPNQVGGGQIAGGGAPPQPGTAGFSGSPGGVPGVPQPAQQQTGAPV